MAQVSFGSFSKKRNSTKQPASLSDTRTVNLKEACSQDRPVFICTGNNFNYNYCMWDGKYYFIDEIVSLHNNLIEIHCIMDPLATYKADIIAGTQFVSYSAGGSRTASAWVEDTRIPVQHNEVTAVSTASMGMLFTAGGFFVVSVIGQTGCDVWIMDNLMIARMLDKITNWGDDLIDNVIDGYYPWSTGTPAATYDFSAPEKAIESMSKMNALTGLAGNAYAAAPSCIRSCIWVPFFLGDFITGGGYVFLGQFPTDINTSKCKTEAVTGSTSVNIPWQNTGWRRATCESVYLYLPLVGMVNIPSDEIVNQTSITVEWSATATDGCIAYRIISGSQVIGTYGANAAVNYPIGISQQASAGEIVQTGFAGIEKVMNAAINSSISPISMEASALGMVMAGIETSYNVQNTKLTRHNSCVGGIGGGAGIGLSLDLTCFTVSHPTVVPAGDADYKTAMGDPIMKAIALNTCEGFTQCVNAHVDAPATAGELNAIDAMLNSGFYIE